MSEESYAQIIAGILVKWQRIERFGTSDLIQVITLSLQNKPFDFGSHPVASKMLKSKSQICDVVEQIEIIIKDNPGIEDFRFKFENEDLTLGVLIDMGKRRIEGLNFAYQDFLNDSRKS